MAQFDWMANARKLAGLLEFDTGANRATTFLGVNGWPREALPASTRAYSNFRVYLMARDWEQAKWANAASNARIEYRAVAGGDLEVHVADQAFSAAAVCPAYVQPDRFHSVLSPYQGVANYLFRKLMPGGMGLLVLPLDALEEAGTSLVRSILARFEVLHMGRLDMDKHYPTVPMALVLRARPRTASVKAHEAKALTLLLSDPGLPAFTRQTVVLPAAASLDVEPFESTRVNPDAALAAARASTLFNEVANEAGRPGGTDTPPLPLRLGHVALQLATGRLDGVVGDGAHRHVVKGRVVRRAVSETEKTEDGEVTVTHDVLGVEITALGEGGEVFAFASGEGGEGA